MILYFLLLLVSTIPNNSSQLSTEGLPHSTLTVTVYGSGKTFVGKKLIEFDSLASELSNQLLKSYRTTKKMPSKIKVVYKGEVYMGVRGSTMDGVLDGITITREKICQSKYKKSFEELSAPEQKQLRLTFPVLFQETFS